MDILPIGTEVKRTYDDAIYVKSTYSEDPKVPCKWQSRTGFMFVSDTAIRTNTNQYQLLEDSGDVC